MIYVAGKFTSQVRLREEAQKLRRGGFTVSSTWLDETATDYNATEEYKVECAQRDVDEVLACNTLILDTIDVSDTGGREVELGLALQGDADWIILVGPRRNVFHYLPEITHFKTWDELHGFLAGIP